jgi:hypothetical protein
VIYGLPLYPKFMLITALGQGDNFKLNVIDKLSDKSLDLATSIVRSFYPGCDLASQFAYL